MMKKILKKLNKKLEEMSSIDNTNIEEESEEDGLYFKDLSEKSLMIFTNLIFFQFNYLFSLVLERFSFLKGNGGRKTYLSNKYLFYILLRFLKGYEKFSVLSSVFKISASTIQKIIFRMIDEFTPLLYGKFVKNVKELVDNENSFIFKYFPNVRLIVYCSIQEVPRYSNNFADNKIFFSQKHGKYCIKKEYVHLLNGMCCGNSEFFPGATYDFKIFSKKILFYKQLLESFNINEKKRK